MEGEPSGAAAAHGGGLGQVGEAILQELRMLREALGEVKEEFSRLGDRLAERFAEDRPEVWEEDWILEEDKDWVKEESAAIRTEKADYREFVRKRREAEEGVSEEVRGPEGKAEVGEKEQSEEEEDEEKEGGEEEEEEGVESVGPEGETERGSEETGVSVRAEETTE